jgi:predicted TIM-barrel fold metal-dependent hydrolase
MQDLSDTKQHTIHHAPPPSGLWDSMCVLTPSSAALQADGEHSAQFLFEPLLRVHRQLGVERALITESADDAVPGHNALVSALQLGAGRFRGVVRLHWSEGANTIDYLHEMGVRGVRIEPSGPGRHSWDTDEMKRIAALIKRYEWHISMPLLADHVPAQLSVIKSLKADVVVDSCVRSSSNLLFGQRDWTSSRHTWFRLIGTDHQNDDPERYSSISYEKRAAFFERYASRLLYGSAEDALSQASSRHPGYDAFIESLFSLCPDHRVMRTVAVDNPLSLFDH